jgi:hypothetical protein
MATSAFEQAPMGGIAIPITNLAIAGIAIAGQAVEDKARHCCTMGSHWSLRFPCIATFVLVWRCGPINETKSR